VRANTTFRVLGVIMKMYDCKLHRFLDAQENRYAQVVRELKNQKKESHWMWFIFPQIIGLGQSEIAKFYAISSIEEAIAYIENPILGSRLKECCELIYNIEGQDIQNILGYPDDLKLKSSVTLFSLLENSDPVFKNVLDKFYGRQPDDLTLDIVFRMKNQ